MIKDEEIKTLSDERLKSVLITPDGQGDRIKKLVLEELLDRVKNKS